MPEKKRKVRQIPVALQHRRAVTAGEFEGSTPPPVPAAMTSSSMRWILRLHTGTGLDRCLVKATGERQHAPVTTRHTSHRPLSCHHAAARGTVLPTDALLQFRNGRPLTTRHYDHLWNRIDDNSPGSPPRAAPPHHPEPVERHFGYGIARAHACHTDSTGPATTYIKPTCKKSPPPSPR